MDERTGRFEDQRLVTGRGRFTDDLPDDCALHVVFVRAACASARLRSVETGEAARMPGVVAVLTARELMADAIAPVQAPMSVEGPDGHVWTQVPRPLLATDRVRFVGEPVAMVVAETRLAALDAAEAVQVEEVEEAAVTTVADARAEGAARVWPERPGNVAFEWARGDWDAAGAALAAAAHRVHLTTTISRVSAVAMEPRAALARLEGDVWVLRLGHQAPHALKGALCTAFGLPAEAVRVVAQDVGGSFGMKAGPLREEMLCFWAARRLGRAVRWRAERTESFLCDEAGRDVAVEAELGLDATGCFTALRVAMAVNVGAYASGRSAIAIMNVGGIAGVYRTPVIAARVSGCFTHTAPVAPYRGAGRPEATLVIERLVDAAAREVGIDPVTLRRRNLIPPEAMPWRSPFIFDYDVGAFERVLDLALVQADVAGFPARREAAAARGRLRGLGMAMCIEVAGGPYGSPGRDVASVRLEPDGTITLAGGAFSAGQGLETALVDVAARALGVPADRFVYVQGDTAALPDGKGMGGSAALSTCGPAVMAAARAALEAARRVAADILEVAEADLEFADGTFRVVGTDRTAELAAVAARAADSGAPLLGEGDFKPDHAGFPNGCHVCEVDVDPQTGLATIVAYSAVEDIGRVLYGQLAEGQIHGGVAQGLGQVFLEAVRYAPGDGQLLSASLMDYALPRADDLPAYDCAFAEIATDQNPLQVKGVGEAGSVGAVAAGLNAICDALGAAGVERFDMPATPARVWEALRAAAASGR